MALVLTLRTGDAVLIGEQKVMLERISSDDSFFVSASGCISKVVDNRALEIFPTVFLSAGPPEIPGRARLVIDAPREIPITRIKERVEVDV